MAKKTRAAGADYKTVARRADNRDAEVGRRIRSRRLGQKLSQTDLANKIGVTFQQVQKYEKGVNRVGAGRLERISEALEVPPSYFFGSGNNSAVPAAARAGDEAGIFKYLQKSDAVRLVQAFHEVKNRTARHAIVVLVEQMKSA